MAWHGFSFANYQELFLLMSGVVIWLFQTMFHQHPERCHGNAWDAENLHVWLTPRTLNWMPPPPVGLVCELSNCRAWVSKLRLRLRLKFAPGRQSNLAIQIAAQTDWPKKRSPLGAAASQSINCTLIVSISGRRFCFLPPEAISRFNKIKSTKTQQRRTLCASVVAIFFNL